LEHYGVSVPTIRSVAKSIGRLDHDEVVAVVEALWAQPVHERRMVAVELLAVNTGRLGYDDAALLERLLRQSRTWALVDALATAVGWVLRDTARKRPDLVYQWLLPRAVRASGVTLREAVKPLSDEQRTAVMAASGRAPARPAAGSRAGRGRGLRA
jgi:3-methyladenine DNA glycosylase AlkD